MRFARQRALTHQLLGGGNRVVPEVEMRFARQRALTHIELRAKNVIIRGRRNEGCPTEGIDTYRDEPSYLPNQAVEMSIARQRAQELA